MPCAEVLPAFGVFVLAEIFVVSVPVGHLLDLVAFLAKHHELFLRVFGGSLRLVESRVGLSSILDPARGQSFEVFGHPPI